MRSDFRAVVREVEGAGGTKTSARVRWMVGLLARRDVARAWPIKPPAPVTRMCWAGVGREPILLLCLEEIMSDELVGWRRLRTVMGICRLWFREEVLEVLGFDTESRGIKGERN